MTLMIDKNEVFIFNRSIKQEVYSSHLSILRFIYIYIVFLSCFSRIVPQKSISLAKSPIQLFVNTDK